MICDGKPDCDNGSDEKDCEGASSDFSWIVNNNLFWLEMYNSNILVLIISMKINIFQSAL